MNKDVDMSVELYIKEKFQHNPDFLEMLSFIVFGESSVIKQENCLYYSNTTNSYLERVGIEERLIIKIFQDYAKFRENGEQDEIER